MQVRPELITEEEFKANGRIPNVYCLKATKLDPASRLALFVEGTFADGAPFAGWLRSRGDHSVFKMNSFVDMLEGNNAGSKQTYSKMVESQAQRSER